MDTVKVKRWEVYGVIWTKKGTVGTILTPKLAQNSVKNKDLQSPKL